MKQSGIYRIRNTENGHSYVGSSVDLNRRKVVHMSMLRNGSHFNRYLQRAWDLYGAATFVFEAVELCSREQLVEREQYHIDQGAEYNLCRTVGVANYGPLTEEHRAKLSEALRETSAGLASHTARQTERRSVRP